MTPNSAAGPSPRGGPQSRPHLPAWPGQQGLRWSGMPAAGCGAWARPVGFAFSALPTAPQVVPADSPRQETEALQLSCQLWGHGDCQAVALALWAWRLGGPGPRALFYTYPRLLSLSLCLFVTESGGPVAGGSLGGDQPCLPSLRPSPWLFCFCSAATPSPPVPVGAGPVLTLPMPSRPRSLVPMPFPLQGGRRGARADKWTGVRLVLHAPPPASTEQSHGFRCPPVLLLLQPQFYQVSGLHRGRGGERWGQVPEQAQPRGRGPSALLHLTSRGCFQGFFKAADSNLATVEKLTKSFHAVHGSFSLFFTFKTKNPERCIRFV